MLVPDIANRAQFAYDENGQYAFTSGYGLTFHKNLSMSPKYLMGLVNSKLLDYYLKQISTPMQNGFFRYFSQFIEQLPHPAPSTSPTPADVQRHDRMVALVERMLSLHQQLAAAQTPTERSVLQRQIDATDHEIDRLVYELYELTEDEIKIVEGGGEMENLLDALRSSDLQIRLQAIQALIQHPDPLSRDDLFTCLKSESVDERAALAPASPHQPDRILRQPRQSSRDC